MRVSLFFALTLTAALSGCPTARVQSDSAPQVEPDGSASIVVKAIGDVRLHTLIGPSDALGVTSHIIETSAHLIVVDTQLLVADATRLRAYAETLGKPIERVIISHGHPDHYFGVAQFADLPTYALPKSLYDMGWRHKGHWKNHRRMEGDRVTDRVVLPRTELTESELTIDGVTLLFEAVASCEDNMQLIIRLPTQRAMIVQDLVYNGYHPFFFTADFTRWRATLDALKADSRYDYFMAGHGAPGSKDVLTATRSYLVRAEAALADSTSAPDAMRAMMDAYPGLKGGDVILSILEGFKP